MRDLTSDQKNIAKSRVLSFLKFFLTYKLKYTALKIEHNFKIYIDFSSLNLVEVARF